MSDETKVTQEYGAEQIQVLEGLEAVRKRPGMYIGSTSSSGLHHLVYEIVDNSIDEALAGYCTEITVTINEGNTITVTDNGRGIPVGIQPQTGLPAVEVVFIEYHEPSAPVFQLHTSNHAPAWSQRVDPPALRYIVLPPSTSPPVLPPVLPPPAVYSGTVAPAATAQKAAPSFDI